MLTQSLNRTCLKYVLHKIWDWVYAHNETLYNNINLQSIIENNIQKTFYIV